MSPLKTLLAALLPSFIFVGLLCLVLPSAAFAQDHKDPQKSIQVDIRMIYATHSPDHIPPELSSIAPDLKLAFPDYHSFSLLNQHRFSLALNQTQTTPLPDIPDALNVTYRGWVSSETPPLILLDMQLQSSSKVEVRASPGSTFLQARHNYRDGLLVLAIHLDSHP